MLGVIQGKVEPLFWRAWFIKKKRHTLGLWIFPSLRNVAFSRLMCYTCWRWCSSPFVLFPRKYNMKAMMCSRSGVGKYITQFSLPQKYVCISCIDLQSTRIPFIRTGKDLRCLLQYANFFGCWNISLIS